MINLLLNEIKKLQGDNNQLNLKSDFMKIHDFDILKEFKYYFKFYNFSTVLEKIQKK